jgi:hypothetical protein
MTMKLHESKVLVKKQGDVLNQLIVLRVPGGWIYTQQRESSNSNVMFSNSTFVPDPNIKTVVR